MIVADTVATFPLTSGSRRLDADYCMRLGKPVVELLSDAILDDSIDSRAAGISELAALIAERELPPDHVFMFVHIAMGTAIDELSHDRRVGADTEPWPQAAQIVRRAAFDLLAAWTTRCLDMPERFSIEDALTTLHTRPVLDAVLPKECHRAERFEHWVSMMLIDIDNLSEINRAHGYGVGDRILERMGILLRTYFREHDWVVRYSDDTIAVLLPETTPGRCADAGRTDPGDGRGPPDVPRLPDGSACRRDGQRRGDQRARARGRADRSRALPGANGSGGPPRQGRRRQLRRARLHCCRG